MELIKSGGAVPRECGSFSFRTPVSGHIPMPNGADAGRLLARTGEVEVDRLVSESGSVTAEGRVVIRPICAAGDGLYAFESSAPFRQTIPCALATADGAAHGSARLTSLELSPRGAGFELSAQVDAEGFAEAGSPVETAVAVGGAPDTEFLRRELTLYEEKPAGSAAFRLRDELRADGVERVHAWDAVATVETVTERDGEAEVECSLDVSVLYTDEDGAPVQVKHRLPFTETLRLDCAGELRAEVSAQLARVTPYTGDIPMIAIEADVRLSVFASSSRTQLFTLDAFSPATPFAAVTEETPLRLRLKPLSGRATLSERLAPPDGLPAVDRPLYARSTPIVTECAAENGRITVTGLLDTAVLYYSADRTLCGFNGEAPFSEAFDCPANVNGALARVTALADKPRLGGGAVEVEYSLTFELEAYEALSLPLLVSLAEGEPAASPHGLVGYFAAEGETAFSIAKRFSVPVAALNAERDTFARGDKLIFFA